MHSTQILFEDGLDYGLLRSDAPEVVRQVRAQDGVAVVEFDGTTVYARVPLHLLAKGFLFPDNKGLRKMAQSGGNGSLHISH